MNADAGHVTTVSGDAPISTDGPERTQKVARAGQHGGRRRIQPPQVGGVPYTPTRELQSERRQICIDDLGRRKRGQAAMRTFAPGAIGHAGLQSTCAPLTLIGGGPGDSLGFQAAHAGGGIENRFANEP